MLMGTMRRIAVPGRRSPRPGISAMNFWPRRSRPHHRRTRSRLPPFPGLSTMPAFARSQRALHLLAGRQSAGRPDPRPQEFLVGCAVMAGFSQGGGVGLALANLDHYGDPGFDVFAMDVSRYGDYATMAYTKRPRVREGYSRRFSIRFPNEELPAGRPLQTTPIYRSAQRAWARCSASIMARTAAMGSRPKARKTSSPGAARNRFRACRP